VKKLPQKRGPTHFFSKLTHNLVAPKMWSTSVVLKAAQSKQLPKGRENSTNLEPILRFLNLQTTTTPAL
jgi:hypothetical protein